ncbi:hypothetical protein MWU31_24325, partial [Aeromonas hydrophila]|nr:hypothetical protein [Aeromonas hydrophila]
HVEPPAFKVRENSTYEHPGFSGGLPSQFKSCVQLVRGDHINIPARQKHRVEWTHPDMTTVWLCVFY